MRCVSYTRTTTCLRGEAVEAVAENVISQQNRIIRDYMKERGWKLDAKYSDRKNNEQEETAFQKMRLDGTDQKIPLLEDVLKLVNGSVPLLIELKVPNRSLALCPVAARALDRYRGPYIIESFQPFALRWFRKNRPDVLIGQLASRYGKALKINSLFKLLSSSLIVHVVSRPDFVAYNFRTADGLGIDLNQHLFRIPVFAWTVRSEKEYEVCREKQFSTVIFEGFHPEVKEIPALPERISDRIVFLQ